MALFVRSPFVKHAGLARGLPDEDEAVAHRIVDGPPQEPGIAIDKRSQRLVVHALMLLPHDLTFPWQDIH
jgi:hypothetical protein